jgi:hypothetical protein
MAMPPATNLRAVLSFEIAVESLVGRVSSPSYNQDATLQSKLVWAWATALGTFHEPLRRPDLAQAREGRGDAGKTEGA